MAVSRGVLAACAFLALLGCGDRRYEVVEESDFAGGADLEVIESSYEVARDVDSSYFWPEAGDPLQKPGSSEGGVPLEASWRSFLPPVASQGGLQSCVGWAAAYYLMTAWSVRLNGTATTEPFSPEFLYRRLLDLYPVAADPNCASACGATSADRAVREVLAADGCCRRALMSYGPCTGSCCPCPTATNLALEEARRYRMLGGGSKGDYDEAMFKDYLRLAGPFLFVIRVDDRFKNVPRRTTLPGANTPGTTAGWMSLTPAQTTGYSHALCCIGFDDAANGGSFVCVNSWGTSWGASGFAWIPYAVLKPNTEGTHIFQSASFLEFLPSASAPGASLDKPASFVASQADAARANSHYVTLRWAYVPRAQGYALERSPPDRGIWQAIADLGPTTAYHADFQVDPERTYDYRLTPLLSREPRLLDTAASVTARGSTTSGLPVRKPLPGGPAAADQQQEENPGLLVLQASGPAGDVAYPDRVALDWNLLPGDRSYILLRSDVEDGLRPGQYEPIAVLHNEGHWDDYVSPGANFTYEVRAVDAATRVLVAQSNLASGSTSGGLAGPDLAILYAEADLGSGATPAYTDAPGQITYLNDSTTESPSQRIEVGAEWFVDGARSVELEQDPPTETGGPVYREDTGAPLAADAITTRNVLPKFPEWNSPASVIASWWYFRITPLDDLGNVLEDVYPYDNEYVMPDPFTTAGRPVTLKPR